MIIGRCPWEIRFFFFLKWVSSPGVGVPPHSKSLFIDSFSLRRQGAASKERNSPKGESEKISLASGHYYSLLVLQRISSPSRFSIIDGTRLLFFFWCRTNIISVFPGGTLANGLRFFNTYAGRLLFVCLRSSTRKMALHCIACIQPQG